MKKNKKTNIDNHNDIDDFFLESENKKTRTKRNDHDDNMDYSFLEPEKKGRGIVAFIILLLLITGGISYYYFVLDSPKKIFETIASNLLEKRETTNKIVFDFELTPNILTEKDKYQKYTNIINNASIEGTIGADLDKQITNASLLTKYKEKDLLNFSYLIELTEDKNVYVKLNDLLDKTIKVDIDKEISKYVDNSKKKYDINSKNYENIESSLVKALKSAMEEANYTKEYVKIDNTYQKKLTLIIDKEFLGKVYGKLLDDENFIKSYSKINNITESEVIDKLNQEIYDLEDIDKYLSIYLTPLKNEFISLEYLSSGNDLKINKENNTYTYELSKSYTTKYQGYIKINEKVDNRNSLTINFDLLEKETSITVDLIYSYSENQELSSIDKSNAIPYEKLTEEDFSKIIKKISENETIVTLLEDLGLNVKQINSKQKDI